MEGYNEKVNYADLVELGFQKMNMEDRVHLKQYGYDYFILYYGECDDMLYLEWSPVSREVNVYIYFEGEDVNCRSDYAYDLSDLGIAITFTSVD